jgi:hypothetical protein
MDLKAVLEALSKHGVRGLMVIALIWMNSRLNTVEERLYKCYDDKEDLYFRTDKSVKNDNNKNFTYPAVLIAALPNDRKQKEDEKDDK